MCAALVSCGNSALTGQTLIKSTLEGKNEATLYVSYIDDKGYQNETVEVKEGRFEWSKPIAFPTRVVFALTQSRLSPVNAAVMWTEPGALELTLNADNLSDYKLKGSALDPVVKAFEKELEPENNRLHELGIDKTEYYRFAAGFFNAEGRELPPVAFDHVYDRFDGHTWYLQVVLNRLYGYKESPTVELADYAVGQIVAESASAYETLLAAYSLSNIKLLRAIAKEECVREINAGEFISKYNLKAASSVNTSLKKLIDREMVYKSRDGYIVYDRFLAIWLRQQPY